MKKRLSSWFMRYFVNISLNQLNMLSLWTMLFFTVVFTWLTVQEEYKIFERNFQKDSQVYFQSRYNDLTLSTQRITKLIELEVQQTSQQCYKNAAKIASVFSNDHSHFVSLYDADNALVFGEMHLEEAMLSRLQRSSEIVEHEINVAGKREFTLLTLQTLRNGYKLVVGIPAASTQELMAERKVELKSRLIRIILEFVTLAFIIFGIMVGVNKVYNGLLEADVNAFLKFFKEAVNRDAVINPNMIFFTDFKKMVEYANAMVTQLASHKRSLEVLNLSLEDKIKDKTAALEIKNFALEEEKAFSQQLLESQKEFIRYAIHETNTPLSVIVANIDLYTLRHGKNPYLSKIDASVKNLFNIYDDLAYQVKKDQIDYPRKRISLHDTIKSRIEFFSEVAEQAGHSFHFQSSCENFYAFFNETKLHRIIDNNLTNAIKYTLRHEPIAITLHEEDEGCRFSIASRSQPIEDTNKVFEAFYREKSSQQGFGLGLNLVRSICKEEGVRIVLKSDAQMTTFSYIFKRCDEDTVARR